MQAHTRALVAAAAFAFVTGKKVAGLYDHAAKADRRIAAEARGNALQGFDGERGAKFGGNLPEILDAGDASHISFEIDGTSVKGYDRLSATFYEARVGEGLVQVFDYGEAAWFAYDIQDAEAAQSYHRSTEAGL